MPRPQDYEGLLEWLVDRALEHDKAILLLRLACDRLRAQRIVRPPGDRLVRLVGTACQKAQSKTFRLLEPLLTPTRRAQLDHLLTTQHPRGRSRLAWLGEGAGGENPSAIKGELEKIEYLRQLGIHQWDLSVLNPNRRKFLAQVGRRSTNQALERMPEQRRYPILLGLLHETLIDLVDEVVDLYNRTLQKSAARARRELDEWRAATARATNEKMSLFSQIGRLILDPAIPDEQLRQRIFEEVSFGPQLSQRGLHVDCVPDGNGGNTPGRPKKRVRTTGSDRGCGAWPLPSLSGFRRRLRSSSSIAANTPAKDAAQPHEIDRMWRERFGLDIPPLERVKLYLSVPDAWSTVSETGRNPYDHHKTFPEFTLRVTAAEDHMARPEEWTRGGGCPSAPPTRSARLWIRGSDFTNTAVARDERRAQIEAMAFEDLKALSRFDAPHSFVIGYSYTFPRMMGAFTLSGTTILRDGTPFEVRSGTDSPPFGNVDGERGDRPSILDPGILGASVDHPDTAQHVLRRETFDAEAPFREGRGNLARNTFRKDGTTNFNVALARAFPIFRDQTRTLSLRIEFINAFNHPQFDEPNSGLSDPTFGQITDTLNAGRIIQASVRFSF